jgi:hypothetical protein
LQVLARMPELASVLAPIQQHPVKNCMLQHNNNWRCSINIRLQSLPELAGACQRGQAYACQGLPVLASACQSLIELASA